MAPYWVLTPPLSFWWGGLLYLVPPYLSPDLQMLNRICHILTNSLIRLPFLFPFFSKSQAFFQTRHDFCLCLSLALIMPQDIFLQAPCCITSFRWGCSIFLFIGHQRVTFPWSPRVLQARFRRPITVGPVVTFSDPAWCPHAAVQRPLLWVGSLVFLPLLLALP